MGLIFAYLFDWKMGFVVLRLGFGDFLSLGEWETEHQMGMGFDAEILQNHTNI